MRTRANMRTLPLILTLFVACFEKDTGDFSVPADTDTDSHTDTDSDTDVDSDPQFEFDLSLSDAKLLGEDEGRAGDFVASGDINADGFDDVLMVGDDGVCLFSGPVSGSHNVSEADVIFSMEGGVAAGDFNGDAFDDVIIGDGGVYIIDGPVNSDVNLNKPTIDGSGARIVHSGDVSGDGLDDLLVGAYYDHEGGDYAGAVYLVYGPVTVSDLEDADAKILGEEGDMMGMAQTTGDVDGDGVGDILIGNADWDYHGDRGAAYLFHGPIFGHLELTDADSSFLNGEVGWAGGAVSLGDFDGDGSLDAAAADAVAGDRAGIIYIFNGPISGDYEFATADVKLYGSGTQAGKTLAAGDLDADGTAELCIGAEQDEAVYIVFDMPSSGSMSLDDAELKLVGEPTDGGSLTGSALAMGDFDGDTQMDLLTAARQESTNAYHAGAVYLTLGSTLSSLIGY